MGLGLGIMILKSPQEASQHQEFIKASHLQVNGKFTSDQSLIYSAVLHAHNAVISTMKPGINWVDMHIDVDDMIAAGLGVVFMPHGLGYFLGIDTHDPRGYLKGLEGRKEPGLKSLRIIRDLREGMLNYNRIGTLMMALKLPDLLSVKFFWF
ncbi:hypothetical protein Fmac_016007 [Flemingia macrophylla]|uniref:Peptidase M24 domain-containing protein n=1 Tax=Flemingia macrophylla TaxID=520843 RepID=A0ABD1MG62_9FABA